jgi:hypothetical protein
VPAPLLGDDGAVTTARNRALLCKEDDMRPMRLMMLGAVVVVVASARAASAEAIFHCGAAPGDECAFTCWTVDANGNDTGSINFVLAAGQDYGLPDNWKGGRYCVNVAKPHAPTPVRPQCPPPSSGVRVIGDRNG